MMKYQVFLAFLLAIILNGKKSSAVYQKMAQGAKNFGKQSMDSFETGRKMSDAIGQHVIKEGFEFYCSHSGEGADKFIQFVKCDDKHANENYCECMYLLLLITYFQIEQKYIVPIY